MIDFFLFPANYIVVAANPGFDYFTTPQYTILVTVDDGANTVTDTLLIDIIPSLHAPVFTNLPNVTSVMENLPQGHLVMTVEGMDVNPGDVVTYALLNSGVPFSLNTTSKIILRIQCCLQFILKSSRKCCFFLSFPLEMLTFLMEIRESKHDLNFMIFSLTHLTLLSFLEELI